MFYAQINVATGICEAVTEAHARIELDYMIALHEFDVSLLGKRYNATTNNFEEVHPPPIRELAKVEYMKRFTQAERISIRNMGRVNDYVNDYIELMNAAVVVHLDDPDTVDGVNALEAAGALAAGRAVEILA